MRVVFRADATASIGTGHVMRCWALAEEFAARGWQISWQGVIEVPWLLGALAGAGWPVSGPGSMEADVMVVDSYTLGPAYRQELLDLGIPVLAVIDDFHQHLGPGTLWVNPGAPRAVTPSARFLNGPEYALIRSEIRALRALRASGGPPEGLTVLLGGTDFSGLGAVVQRFDLPGPLYAGPGSARSGAVTWLPGGPELLQRAARSRLVVTAAGVSSWEMLHVGVPLGLILAAENQRSNYEWMTSRHWAAGLGTGKDLQERVSDLLADALTDQQRIDGLGAKRVTEALLELL